MEGAYHCVNFSPAKSSGKPTEQNSDLTYCSLSVLDRRRGNEVVCNDKMITMYLLLCDNPIV